MRLVSMLCFAWSCHVTSFWAVIQISMSSRLIRYVFTRAKTALVAHHPPLALACCFDIWAAFLHLALYALPLQWDEMAVYLISFTSWFILKETLVCCLVYGLRLTGLLADFVLGLCLAVNFFSFSVNQSDVLLDLWLFVESSLWILDGFSCMLLGKPWANLVTVVALYPLNAYYVFSRLLFSIYLWIRNA